MSGTHGPEIEMAYGTTDSIDLWHLAICDCVC